MATMEEKIAEMIAAGATPAEIAEAMKNEVATEQSAIQEGGWQEATSSSVAEELENVLLAIRPGKIVKEDGQFGVRNVTLSEVWLLEDEVTMYGDEVPIRWQVVQRQLARATVEAPWIVGRLVKSGRAYLLQPSSPGERSDIASAITVIDAMRTAAVEEPF